MKRLDGGTEVLNLGCTAVQKKAVALSFKLESLKWRDAEDDLIRSRHPYEARSRPTPTRTAPNLVSQNLTTKNLI